MCVKHKRSKGLAHEGYTGKRGGGYSLYAIRQIPDHATFREMEHTLGWLDKLGGCCFSLALYNLSNFDQLYLLKY